MSLVEGKIEREEEKTNNKSIKERMKKKCNEKCTRFYRNFPLLIIPPPVVVQFGSKISVRSRVERYLVIISICIASYIFLHRNFFLYIILYFAS